MLSMNELFYGEREPTCIVRDVGGELQSTYPGMQFYMVPSMEFKVHMCCKKCELKISKHLYRIKGVDGVACDYINQKVTVTGNVEPQKLLKKIRLVKKHADYWWRKENGQR